MNCSSKNPFHITIFDSRFDNKTNKTVTKRNWKKFGSFLQELSKLPYTKKTAPLISPALYKEGTTRANRNVVAWGGWCAIDIDSHSFKSAKEIREYLDSTEFLNGGCSYCCYSTASSTKEKPKFRLVIPLSEWIYSSAEFNGDSSVPKISMFWFALNKELGGMIDKQTKDISRMFYIPADYQESSNSFFWITERESFLDPDWLIRRHKIDELFDVQQFVSGKTFLERLPEDVKNAVIRHRESQLKQNGKYFSWSSWHDCPFVNQEAVNEYKSIVTSGAAGRYRHFYILMVSIASIAIRKEYPITTSEIMSIAKDIDNSIDGFYSKRKIEPEAERALAFVYASGTGRFS